MAQHHRYALRSHVRRKRSSSSSPALRTRSLPLDLLHNVLSRLPTISLLKFRSVCREWRDIIDDPDFAAMHARSGVESPRILLISRPRGVADPQFLVDDELLVTSLPKLGTEPSLGRDGASCHGLHCFEDFVYGVTYIVNPLTREFISWKRDGPPRWQSIGIGVDGRTGRYKIVRVSSFTDRLVGPLRAAVLDQGSRSWRDIASVPSRLIHHGAPVFAAGSIHWKADGGAGTFVRISSFDLTKEEFALTPCPGTPGPKLRDARLVDFQGVLGLLDFSRRESMDVWVMEERGRWMKEYRVQVMSLLSPPSCDVLGCGGRKIAFVHTHIWYLDPATGEMEYTSRPRSGRERAVRGRERAVRGITVSLLSPVKLWNEFCQHEGSL